MFKKINRKLAKARMIDEFLYEKVAEELDSGKRRNGIWLKSLADAEGNEEKAKALYFKYRVQSMKDENCFFEELNEKNYKKRPSGGSELIDESTNKNEEDGGIKFGCAVIVLIILVIFILKGIIFTFFDS